MIRVLAIGFLVVVMLDPVKSWNWPSNSGPNLASSQYRVRIQDADQMIDLTCLTANTKMKKAEYSLKHSSMYGYGMGANEIVKMEVYQKGTLKMLL